MKKILFVLLTLAIAFGLAACGSSQAPLSQFSEKTNETDGGVQGREANNVQHTDSDILIAYAAQEEDGVLVQTARQLQKATDGHLFLIEEGREGTGSFASYEFVLLGFEAEKNVMPEIIETFLEANDFGAKTILPFVAGGTDDSEKILEAVSLLQPGALLGSRALLLSEDLQQQDVTKWIEEEGLLDEALVPKDEEGNTVASAVITPKEQQVLYLWEKGSAPAATEYTENNGRYSDDPDFRPYLTSYPVPEGTEIKGAVLICPGGAFQFRSDRPEGMDVAEELSALGYQSFVIDYRLRPYTQQEGALDLARAVRFVRAHAEEYGIDEKDIAVMGFSAGGILGGEMLLNFDGQVNGTALDSGYVADELDQISADAAACGMIYSFYGRLSVGTTDVELLRSGSLPPTFYCYGTLDPFYDQFLANADAAQEAGITVERLQLDGMPHGFGAQGDWIPAYDRWLQKIFEGN